jgi:hypothetical protein
LKHHHYREWILLFCSSPVGLNS